MQCSGRYRDARRLDMHSKVVPPLAVENVGRGKSHVFKNGTRDRSILEHRWLQSDTLLERDWASCLIRATVVLIVLHVTTETKSSASTCITTMIMESRYMKKRLSHMPPSGSGAIHAEYQWLLAHDVCQQIKRKCNEHRPHPWHASSFTELSPCGSNCNACHAVCCISYWPA